MTCDEFAASSVPGASPESRAALAGHAARCAPCAGLARLEEDLRKPAAPPAMSDELRQALAGHRPTRVRYDPWRRALVPSAAAAAVLGVLAFWFRRPDFDRLPAWLIALMAVGFLGFFAAGLQLLLARGPAGTGASLRARIGYVALAACAYVSLSLAWADSITGAAPLRPFHAWISANLAPTLGAWTAHLPCAAVGLVSSLAVLGAVLVAGARTAVGSPGLAGAVAGTASAMAAAFVLFGVCASHSVGHIVGVHAVGISMAIAVGALAGRRVLAT